MKAGKPITKKLNQLMVITGAKGVGKSTALATFLPPSKIDKVAAVDTENSLNNFRDDLNAQGKDFGLYINTLERFKGKLPSEDDLLNRIKNGDAPWVGKTEKSMFIDYFQYMIEEINQIPRNKYDYLFIDTGEKLEAGMAAYVEENKRKFGVTGTEYGKLWVNGVFPLYQHILQGIWDRGVGTVGLSFHLKNVWLDKRPIPGKVTHAGKKILYQLSSFMVWLVNDSRNPQGAPAGLVLKERWGNVGVDGDEWDIQTMLPPRIPVFTWKHVNQYLQNGYDVLHPDPREVLSEGEREMISELLTDAQIRLMLQDARLEEQENTIALAQAGLLPVQIDEVIQTEEGPAVPKNKAEAITAWKATGKTVPELLKKLKERGIGDDQISERWAEVLNGKDD